MRILQAISFILSVMSLTVLVALFCVPAYGGPLKVARNYQRYLSPGPFRTGTHILLLVFVISTALFLALYHGR